MIGLGMRAGSVVSGDMAVKSALDRGKVKLLVIAQNASERTRNKLIRLAGMKNVPMVFFGSKEELGRLIGKTERSSVAFTDKKMAEGILRALEGGGVNRTEIKPWR